MVKLFFAPIFLVLAFFISLPGFAQTETLTITTYYPAPFGVYRNLRLFPTPTADAGICDNAHTDSEGIVYYDNTLNRLRVCTLQGGILSWQDVGGSFWTFVDNPAPIMDFIYPNDNNWNVGIGTNNPQRKLHVVDVNSGTPSVLSIQNTDTTDGNGLCLSFRGVTTGVGADNFSEFAAVKGRFISHLESGRIGALDFHVAGPINSVHVPVMTINGTNRNVGIDIGEGIPQAKLEVKGTVKIGDPNPYTLPPQDGTSGQALVTNGVGVVSWQNAGGSGNIIGCAVDSWPGCTTFLWGTVTCNAGAFMSCPAGYTSRQFSPTNAIGGSRSVCCVKN
ncbi:MAG: hypothetical protein WC412_02285 [Candidatus Omnitrophota bacterium]|jgi:hypothetical protein